MSQKQKTKQNKPSQPQDEAKAKQELKKAVEAGLEKTGTKKQETEEEGVKDKSKKKLSSKEMFQYYLYSLRFYYVPVFIVAIFLFIGIFAVYPSTLSLLESMSTITDLQDDVDAKEQRIEKLEQLQDKSTQTHQYLQYINKIAPIEKTNVTNFQTAIKQVAKENNLVVEDAIGGEEIISDEGGSSPFQLVEVPMNFTLVGSFGDLKRFLTNIYLGENFIIIQRMDLAKSQQEASVWTMQITLVKYQFVEPNEAQTEVQIVAPASTEEVYSEDQVPNQDVLNFLDEKYIVNDEGGY